MSNEKKTVGVPGGGAMADRLDEAALAALVRRTCAGDVTAWKELWHPLAELVENAAGRFPALGPLSESADARADVVAQVMEDLRREDFRRLAEMGALLALRGHAWRRWLATVASNAARMHVRAHPDYLGPVEGGGPRWARYAELPAEQAEERPDPVRHIEARRILAWARKTLSPAQYDVLVAWLQHASYDEIAREQSLEGGAEEAQRVMGSAVKRLRYHFAEERPCPQGSLPRGTRRGGPK
jgi:hypothetical protein